MLKYVNYNKETLLDKKHFEILSEVNTIKEFNSKIAPELKCNYEISVFIEENHILMNVLYEILKGEERI